MRLYINLDHVATVRQARRTDEPDPVRAAVLAELGGADGITVHLREDRRHIQERDVELLGRTLRTAFNLEVAAAPEMIERAARWMPAQVTLVPERREEITTEGGLELGPSSRDRVSTALRALSQEAIRTSLFIDPDERSVRTAAEFAPVAVELHTGEYANARDSKERERQLGRLRTAARLGRELGLDVHAGHGLTYENVGPVAAVSEIEELNIGHSVVSRALLVGMERAVREMRARVVGARRAG